MKVNRV